MEIREELKQKRGARESKGTYQVRWRVTLTEMSPERLARRVHKAKMKKKKKRVVKKKWNDNFKQ